MKMHKLVYLMAGVLVLSASVVCTARPQKALSNSNSLIATPTALQASERAETQRPLTKTATISVEGEKTDIKLRLYNPISKVFTTYFPEKDFVVKTLGFRSGVGVRFYANFGGIRNDSANLQIYYPVRPLSLEDLRQFVTGRPGLITDNKWQVVSRTQNVPYSWAREKIVFNERRGNENLTGAVYLGEQNGKAFFVITHYPVEYGDGFEPRAALILQNLQFSN